MGLLVASGCVLVAHVCLILAGALLVANTLLLSNVEDEHGRHSGASTCQYPK
jgi:hypothetical protein